MGLPKFSQIFARLCGLNGDTASGLIMNVMKNKHFYSVTEPTFRTLPDFFFHFSSSLIPTSMCVLTLTNRRARCSHKPHHILTSIDGAAIFLSSVPSKRLPSSLTELLLLSPVSCRFLLPYREVPLSCSAHAQ